ncbi:MAG TPA: DNA mismatch repair protein MutS, partial [Dehalococcoidia bacterium]|nr:DNA mismatch repair protein MutS [Dehalococcoidia bacterium]
MTTPIRRQYLEVKARHPDAIVLFRLGDFYEAFDDDAHICARELDLTLTSKPMGKGLRVPLAGIPHHALDGYVSRLVARGHRVAICEQLADPSAAKGLVPRDVVRVVTPGTVLESSVLEGRTNAYLVAVVAGEGDEAGVAWADVSTGEFVTMQLALERVGIELARLQPSELLLPPGAESLVADVAAAASHVEPLSHRDAEAMLLEHFGSSTLDAFGCAGRPLAVQAAATVLAWVKRVAPSAAPSLARLATRPAISGLVLDAATRRNLELFPRAEAPGASLLETLDLTCTAKGARLLRRWLGEPLCDVPAIVERQDAVALFFEDALLRGEVVSLLRALPDVERLAGRTAAGYSSPREVAALRRGLEVIPQVIGALGEHARRFPNLRALPDVAQAIAATLVDDPPLTLDEGGVVRDGVSPDLDRLRAIARDARAGLAELEAAERERTGIRSLRVGYQRVFGYYIEVSNAQRSLVPDDYEPRQTLTNCQRYVTPALRTYETQVLEARERIVQLETDVFRRLCSQLGGEVERIRSVSDALAEIDVYVSFAEAAARYGYVRPEVQEDGPLVIREGRHPVIERRLPPGAFVPNDTMLDAETCQIVVITGPNMAGKSTYLRQVALIALMAHMGAYVPASAATIGLIDRIFTRVGAQDELAAGRSTFMVEMVETATILNQATSRSLVPDDYEPRQTLTNCQRYVTPALRTYETQVLEARERIVQLETDVFRRL